MSFIKYVDHDEWCSAFSMNPIIVARSCVLMTRLAGLALVKRPLKHPIPLCKIFLHHKLRTKWQT